MSHYSPFSRNTAIAKFLASIYFLNVGHFLTLQFLPTLKKMGLKMALSAPNLFILSANIPKCQMRLYKKSNLEPLAQLILHFFRFVLSDKTNGVTQLTKKCSWRKKPKKQINCYILFTSPIVLIRVTIYLCIRC